MNKEKTPELQEIYDHGYDAGKNGANTLNCNFRLFSTPERTKAWSRGNDAGSHDRDKNIKKVKVTQRK